MKLTSFFLLVCCLQLGARGFSQRISISEKNASLEKVFKKIEKQTSYVFFYNQELLHRAKKVNLNVQDVPLTEVLDLCFKDQPFTYQIITNTIVIKEEIKNSGVDSVQITAQVLNVKGRVTNENGESLEGITVTVKGTGRATATNADGSFLLNGVDETEVLVFTGINVQMAEIRINGRSDLGLVRLKSKVVSADEITITVNTGYQSIPKERVTGSFSTISPSRLERKLQPDLLSTLEGQASGLVVTKEGGIEIRGRSTFVANASPLIVVDGYPYPAGLESLNIDNIENITVLKDAVAASIYGARSSNGVIVVTTKAAKKGKVQISFKSVGGLTLKPDLSKLNLAGTSDYIDAQVDAYNDGSSNVDYYFDYYAKSSRVNYLLVARDRGWITSATADAEIEKLRGNNNLGQMEKYLFRNQLSNQHSITISGGSDKSLVSAAVRYVSSRNTMVHDEDNRVLFDIKNEWKPSDRVTVRLFSNINYFTSSAPLRKADEFYAYFDNSLLQPYDLIVDPATGKSQNVFAARPELVSQFSSMRGLKPMDYNPLEDLLLEKTRSQNFGTRIGGSLTIALAPGLSLEGGGAWSRGSGFSRSLSDVNSYRARLWYNSATSISDPLITHYIPDGAIVDESRNISQSYTLRGQLNFSKTIGSRNRVSALAGTEINKDVIDDNVYPTRLGYNDQAGTFSSFNYSDYNNFTYYGDMLLPDEAPYFINEGSFRFRDNRFVSWYSNASYEYDNRFILSGSVRLDQTNFWGTNPDYRYRPNWSVGGTYKLGDERFFQLRWINRLNLRGSFGINGNISLTQGPFLIISAGSYSPTTGNVSYSITSPPNNDLRWERTNIVNLGMDASFFNKRLSLTVDYYNKLSKDLLSPDVIDPTYGRTTIIRNVGELRNRGIELSLESDLLAKKNFKWNALLTTSFNTSKVLKFNYAFPYTTYLTIPTSVLIGSSGGFALREGYAMDAIFSYPFAGLDNTGSATFYNTGKQKVNGANMKPEDLVYSGTIRPKQVFGLTNTFTYGKLDLSFMFIAKLGHVLRADAFTGSNYQNRHVGERWKSPGDENKTIYPKLGYYSSDQYYFPFSDILVQSANYMKLRDVTLGYTIESSFLQRAGFRSARIQFQGRNLLLVAANKAGIDPEVSELEGSGEFGRFTQQGYLSLPLRPQFYLGLSLNF